MGLCEISRIPLHLQLTWVDIYFAAILEFLCDAGKKRHFDLHLDRFPKLYALLERVWSQEGISTWRKTRPHTQLHGPFFK